MSEFNVHPIDPDHINAYSAGTENVALNSQQKNYIVSTFSGAESAEAQKGVVSDLMNYIRNNHNKLDILFEIYAKLGAGTTNKIQREAFYAQIKYMSRSMLTDSELEQFDKMVSASADSSISEGNVNGTATDNPSLESLFRAGR